MKERGNEYETVANVTAKCKYGRCNWQTTGTLKVEVHTGVTSVFSEIFDPCREHHENTRVIKGSPSFHNQFLLFQNDVEVGFASVSSASASGLYSPHSEKTNTSEPWEYSPRNDKIENLIKRLELVKKHGVGGALFIIISPEEVSDKVRQIVSEHPKTERLVFPDEKSLEVNHDLLKHTQFKAEEGILQIIEIPEELYKKALRGELGQDIQKSMSDAFARRIGIIDEA